MPKIAEFYGIDIYMYYKEHGVAHFHAIYSQFEVVVTVDPVRVLEGQAPRRVRSLVFEWAAMYQEELRENWELARRGESLRRLPPLE